MALSCPLRRTAAFEGRAIAVLFLTGRLRNTAERLGKITSVSDYDAPFAAGLSKGAALRLSSAAMGDLDIAVAGCGIAGLAAALLLDRQGHAVTIYERFYDPKRR